MEELADAGCAVALLDRAGIHQSEQEGIHHWPAVQWSSLIASGGSIRGDLRSLYRRTEYW